MFPTPTPTSTLMTLFLGILTFIILMLLPSFVELKRPKDPGPRIIKDHGYATLHDLEDPTSFARNESRFETLRVDNSVLKEIAAILAALPSLEA